MCTDIKISDKKIKNNTQFLFPTIFFLFFFFYFGCKSTEEESYESPTIISGQVTDQQHVGIANARVMLSTAPQYEANITDENGLFHMKNFPSGKHTLKVEKIGFEIFETQVGKPINGVSTMNPMLTRKIYTIPKIKPQSKGAVRIRGKILETDFDANGVYEQFIVKGTAFSPVPIGNKPIPEKIYDRSIEYLMALHANTVRTYSGVSKYFLKKASENNIRVIVGYWVNMNIDLSIVSTRKKIVEDFSNFVFDLKDYSGVLMWNIGNEQNYSSTQNNGNSQYWYSLVQEMAIAAYKVEGEKYHPVCISNGALNNIGNSMMKADDSSLTYVDVWGTNTYTWDFSPIFVSFKSKSAKPIVITEYGIDALDNRSKTEYEQTQAEFDSTNWTQINNARDVCVGSTVFVFSDEWWKDEKGSIHEHDFGGYATSAHPDGYSNEEWWGIIAVTPDANNDGLDEWRARKAYYMFQRQWK